MRTLQHAQARIAALEAENTVLGSLLQESLPFLKDMAEEAHAPPSAALPQLIARARRALKEADALS